MKTLGSRLQHVEQCINSFLSDSYQFISQRAKEISVVLALNVLAYFVYISQFLLNNHGGRFTWIDPTEQLFAGRWFTPFLFWLNNSGNIPTFTPLVFILLSILSAVLVVQLWGYKLSRFRYVLILSLLTLYPAFTGGLYYHYASFIFPASILLSVGALLLACRMSILSIIGASLLVTFSLASNQPALSTLSTLFVTYCIVVLVMTPLNDRAFLVVFKNDVLPKIMSIVLGVLLYKISLPLFGIGSSHASSTIAPGQILTHAGTVISRSFDHLIISQPEFQSSIKYILLSVVILAFVTLLIRSITKNHAIRAKLISVVLLFVLSFSLVLATKAMYFVSDTNNFYEYRYNFALAYFYAFTFFVLLSHLKSKYLGAVVNLVAIFIVLRFIQADLIRQGVLLRGQSHDMALANRILYRIESLPQIDPDKEYLLVRVGNYPNYRLRELSSRGHGTDKIGSNHMDYGYISGLMAAGSVMELLGSTIKFKHTQVNPNFRRDAEEARELIELEGRLPWPHPSSVFINDDKVIVYLKCLYESACP